MDLKFRIKERVIYPIDAKATTAILSENTDYYLVFDFDDEWDDQIKTVRLRRERAKDYEDITLMDNQNIVQIPAYMMQTGTIVIGVYSPEMATRPYSIRVLPSVLDNDVRQEFPDKMLYRQLLQYVSEQTDLSSLSRVAITGEFADLLNIPTAEPIEGDDWTYIIKSGIFFGWYKSTESTSITSNLNQNTYQSNSSLIIDFPEDIELTSLIHADVSVRGSLPTWPIIYGKSVDSITFKLTSTQTQDTQNYDIEAFAVGLI